MKEFIEEMQANDLAPLWEIYEDLVMDEPNRAEPSVIWKWDDMLPLIERSAELVQGKNADHRVLILKNPHLDGRMATTSNIVAAYQCVNPGEKTPPHRHTPAATRVILEGRGGGTFVDGKRCDMYDGDLIITPNWTWHCHDNDSGQRAIWLDVLDLPLVGQLDAVFGDMKMGPEERYPANSSTLSDNVYEKAGLAPVTRLANVRHSPRLRYGWEDVAAVLKEAPEQEDGSRTVRYTSPVDGEDILPTHDSRVLSLSKGKQTARARSTANAVCVVIEGSGTSEIGEATHRWSERDVFTIPHWSWASHTSSTGQASMIVISDRQVMEKLNLYREETG
ncbi:MAG: cupin domain-containing protein [Rhodospirillales bacterium]|nr:cupin domain-containing protein [Rhodospirillales bacterium]